MTNQDDHNNKLSAADVLADLLGSEDWPGEISDTRRGAELVLWALADAGFALIEAKSVADCARA